MTSFQNSQIARALSSAKDECVLATLVGVSGSSYRRVGARMLILPNKEIAGAITAGCLEEDIRLSAFEWTARGPCVKVFCIGTAEDDLLGWGSGCKGTLRVLLQRISPRDYCLELLSQACERRQSTAMATLIDSESTLKIGTRFLIVDGDLHSDTETDVRETLLTEARRLGPGFGARTVEYATPRGRLTFLWESVVPPVQLFVFGAGAGVAALLNLARDLGWKTLLCNKRTELFNRQCGLHPDRYVEGFGDDLAHELNGDARTAAVVMTHHFADDFCITESLVRSTIPYVGVLGGKTRNQRLRDELTPLLSTAQLGKLIAPIGLDIGAEEPVEIAVSITSQVLAFMNDRNAGHLFARPDSIHEPSLHEQRIVRSSPARELAELLEH